MKIAPSEDVAFSESPGAVLVHRHRNSVLPLDARELSMWRALCETENVEDAHALLRRQAQTPKDFPARELYRFVTVLAGHKLIRVVEDPLLARGLRSLRHRGLGATVVSFSGWTRRRIVAVVTGIRQRAWWWIDAAFDRRHGTDTSGRVWPAQLGAQGPSLAHAYEFIPSPTAVFRRALREAVPDPAGYTFVDYGSGKGRTLLLAAELPFKQIIGVDFSPTLQRIARENLRVYPGKQRRCHDIKTLCCDAVDFELPKDDLVLYFYTPFRAPVIEQLSTIVSTSFTRYPRRLIVIVYAWGEGYVDLFRRMPAVTRCREIPLPRLQLRPKNTRLYVLTNH